MTARARVTVITAGHPSTCPRMVKAADALAGAGFDVRLVCTRFIDWAVATDARLIASRAWTPVIVDYHRRTAPVFSQYARARRRAALAIVAVAGAERGPWWAVTRSFSYVHPELVRAALAEPCDFFYGGTTGALAAVAAAAVRARRPYGLDFEDLHTAEREGPDARVQHALASRIESAIVGGASLLTASSHAIGAAYQERYGREVETLYNVFPLPSVRPVIEPRAGALRCYWFSQTISAGRGLELFVDAAALAGVPIALEVRGREDGTYLAGLRARIAATAPRLTLDVRPPAPPDQMVALAAPHDIGLSLELPTVENKNLCVSNKLLTYLPAGLAVIATDTLGMREVAPELGAGLASVKPGDIAGLAHHLRRWHDDRAALALAREDAWRAAARRWHWEHPSQRDKLIDLVRSRLPAPGSRSPEPGARIT